MAKFDFRCSNRIALGVDDTARATRALEGVLGTRLTYRKPDLGTEAAPSLAGRGGGHAGRPRARAGLRYCGRFTCVDFAASGTRSPLDTISNSAPTRFSFSE